ncbi:MAG: hypothetical protein U0992_01105 [Planctomycetaceae bacterium]
MTPLLPWYDAVMHEQPKRNRRPLVSRGGQITLYVIVVVIALLAGVYAGGVYYAMTDDISRILNANGFPPNSREHGNITAIVLMGVPAIARSRWARCGLLR